MILIQFSLNYVSNVGNNTVRILYKCHFTFMLYELFSLLQLLHKQSVSQAMATQTSVLRRVIPQIAPDVASTTSLPAAVKSVRPACVCGQGVVGGREQM